MAKTKTKVSPEKVFDLPKTTGPSLVIKENDPLASYVVRELKCDLPVTITAKTPNVIKVVKSYLVRASGSTPPEYAATANEFLKQLNKESK